jgi:hypothetical protein
MQYVGIDWAYRRAAWCAMEAHGAVTGEGFVRADETGWPVSSSSWGRRCGRASR